MRREFEINGHSLLGRQDSAGQISSIYRVQDQISPRHGRLLRKTAAFF